MFAGLCDGLGFLLVLIISALWIMDFIIISSVPARTHDPYILFSNFQLHAAIIHFNFNFLMLLSRSSKTQQIYFIQCCVHAICCKFFCHVKKHQNSILFHVLPSSYHYDFPFASFCFIFMSLLLSFNLLFNSSLLFIYLFIFSSPSYNFK